MRKLLVVLVLVVLVLGGCAKPAGQAPEGMRVVCTVFPCYDLARALAPEGASVSMLIKPGVEPHAFEPTPQDILAIQNADAFIYIGGENEQWVERILGAMPEDKPARLKLISHVEQLTETEEDGSEGIDEHIWTSIDNAQKMADAIAEAIGADPEKRERLGAELGALKADYQGMVRDAQRKELVFGDRFPFRYLAEEFGLTAYAAFPNCTGETEPSARQLAELIERIAKDGIPVVYKVDASSDAIAKAIAKPSGAQIETLWSCHNVSKRQLDAGASYISLMRENLEALRKGLNER